MRRPLQIALIFALPIISIGLIVALYRRPYTVSHPTLPYHDNFETGQMKEWKSYGGLWSVRGDSVVNLSDERGAKLITGSSEWKDYQLSAEVKLVAQDSDAGLIADAAEEELGVDSYSGYYAGLRTRDNSLVLGRADHQWLEYETREVPGGVDPSHWYRLTLSSKDCVVRATAYNLTTKAHTSIERRADLCVSNGRVGLRSYSTGGAWRHVSVAPFAGAAPALPLPPDITIPSAQLRDSGPLSSEIREFDEQLAAPPLMQVRTLPWTGNGKLVSVRGTVVLTTPSLYVEDGTGGVRVEAAQLQPLRIGDEVQVTGVVERNYFDAAIKDASGKFLWAGDPWPPISIGARQAAYGTVASRFIETEGTLLSMKRTEDHTTVLTMADGGQIFQAKLHSAPTDALIPDLSRTSVLRLRGVCSVDRAQTGEEVPFVILLRSAEDVQVIKGPPWWTVSHIAALLLGAAISTLLIYTVMLRVRHAQLEAVMYERGRFAHEIHDTMAQSFAGIEFQLRAIKRTLPDGILPNLADQVDLASQMVRHSHEEARRNISVLRPETLSRTELLELLSEWAQHLVGDGSVAVEARSVGEIRPLPLELKDAAFRIGLEALANAFLHGQPTHILLTVEHDPAFFALEVADNGRGFDPTVGGSGFGMTGMQTRARKVGAHLEISSAPEKGCRVRMVVSLKMPNSLRVWKRLLLRMGMRVYQDVS